MYVAELFNLECIVNKRCDSVYMKGCSLAFAWDHFVVG